MTMSNTEAYTLPAVRERKRRLEAFKRFIEQNRKSKSYRRLIAIFALETGLRERLVKEYLDLLLRAGVYVKRRGSLLSPEEYKKRVEKEKKEAETKRLVRERMRAEAQE